MKREYPELKAKKLSDASNVYSVLYAGIEFHYCDDADALTAWRRLKDIIDKAIDVENHN